MKKTLTGAALAALLLVGSAVPAFAAKPELPTCDEVLDNCEEAYEEVNEKKGGPR